MTFCLGITTHDGLVGLADTRVLSGNECLVARKTACYTGPGFSFFILTSGLRSLRDKVLLHFDEAFARDTTVRDRLFKTVKLFANQIRRVAEEDRAALEESNLKFNIFTLIGGQMVGDSSHRLFLVYPEGNWVDVGPDTPYQIIGASGYGKPILERSIKESDSILYAFKVGILAFDATRLCAADVGFPIDVHVLLCGPPGLGKTTLAHIVAREMGAQLRVTSGPVLEKAGDVAAILTNLAPGDVL